MTQVKVERISTDPVQAKISTRGGEAGTVREHIVSNSVQAAAMTNALENSPQGNLLGVWRGPGA